MPVSSLAPWPSLAQDLCDKVVVTPSHNLHTLLRFPHLASAALFLRSAALLFLLKLDTASASQVRAEPPRPRSLNVRFQAGEGQAGFQREPQQWYALPDQFACAMGSPCQLQQWPLLVHNLQHC